MALETAKTSTKRPAFTVREMTIVALFAVLAIIGSKISIPVFTIPFSLQFQVCLLTGLLLGARYAFMAQGIYLALGLIGLPVFALGGGLGYVLQPSFGYLPGMMIASALVGWLADQADPQRQKINIAVVFLINLAGLIIVYLSGVAYLYFIQNYYAGQQMFFVRAIQLGMLPFLITDILHCLLAALIAPMLRRLTRTYVWRSLPGIRAKNRI